MATPSWRTPRPASSPSPAPRPWAWRFTSAPPKAQPGQIWIKRTILEMGGKNSILVCADADLDLAVEGVVASAFGYSGQKCSACSRAIIEAPVYEDFVEKLEARVAQLTVGDPIANPNLGPVGEQDGPGLDFGLYRNRQERSPADCRWPCTRHPPRGATSWSLPCLPTWLRMQFWRRKRFFGAGSGADSRGQLRGGAASGQ